MFNVPALLLDDTLKPEKPLTNVFANFENRLIVGKVKAYKNGANFGPLCIWYDYDTTRHDVVLKHYERFAVILWAYDTTNSYQEITS